MKLRKLHNVSFFQMSFPFSPLLAECGLLERMHIVLNFKSLPLGGFHILAIVNSNSVSIGVYVFVHNFNQNYPYPTTTLNLYSCEISAISLMQSHLHHELSPHHHCHHHHHRYYKCKQLILNLDVS